jgi:hypothetical protein
MEFYLSDIPRLKLVKWEYIGMGMEDIDVEYVTGDKIKQRTINFEILRVEHGQ